MKTWFGLGGGGRISAAWVGVMQKVGKCQGNIHCLVSLSLSSVFYCRAGSGYPKGYPVLGNSRGGFPLPSSGFVIPCCDQSFPSAWHCFVRGTLPVLPSCPLSRVFSYLQPGDAVVAVVPQPSANLSHQQTPQEVWLQQNCALHQLISFLTDYLGIYEVICEQPWCSSFWRCLEQI